MKHISRFAVLLKRLIIFVGSLVVIFFVYVNFLPDVWRRTNLLVAIVLLWFVTAYLALPRIHRLLSRIYVPTNFIGRTRTSDGLLSDPVNMGLVGGKRQLIDAMEATGWQQAEPLSPRSIWRAIRSNVLRQSYPTAPVSEAFLFGKKEELAFQMEVGNNPHKRHHVRFWRTPEGWYLPGGIKVDWLGAATYDDAVGLSMFTMQFTHRIDSNVDKERDFVISTLQDGGFIRKIHHIEHVFSGYKTRNGFGDNYVTDGSVVVAEIKKK
jgi:hypothetical protein